MNCISNSLHNYNRHERRHSVERKVTTQTNRYIYIYTRDSRENYVTKQRHREACNATIIDKVWVRISTGANKALLVLEKVNKTSYQLANRSFYQIQYVIVVIVIIVFKF
jgi:hypothetical protein